MNDFIIIGAVLIPNRRMLRFHDEVGFYEVALTEEQIVELHKRVGMGDKLKFNKEHTTTIIEGIKILDSFLLDDERRNEIPEYCNDLPNGTWMIVTEFEDAVSYEAGLKNTKGFSFEFPYSFEYNGKTIHVLEKFRRINGVSNLMTVNLIIHGGDKTSTGRNEHGVGHFEVQQKNSNFKIGDIKIPTVVEWNSFNEKEKMNFVTVYNGEDLGKRDKQVLIHWLNIDENLLMCIKHWNKDNEGNTRAFQIPI